MSVPRLRSRLDSFQGNLSRGKMGMNADITAPEVYMELREIISDLNQQYQVG